MMFLCTSRFDFQEESFTFLKEFFSLDEIEAAKEEREDMPNQIELDPISDNEEEGTQEEGNEAQQPVSSSDELDLPVTGTQTRRTSERARKRPREEDNQWSYH
jgi:hypothetical protein